MKKIFLAIAVTVLFVSAFGQKISKIDINKDGSFDMMSVLLDENATLTMKNDGSIIAWGIEVFSERIPSMSKLDVYPGRVEYYSANDNEAFSGKVKYIGKTLITYYASFDNEAFRGKVKSIGTANFQYYTLLENEAYSGKIKQVGSVPFSWFSTYDNEAMRGKLKSVGSTNLNYYTSFEDKLIRGKLKNIDRSMFTYYTSTDRKEFQGAVKSGSQLQTINGIKYFVRF